MVQWTPTELGMFVSLCCASVATVIYSIQKSKCTEIKCGCVQCVRDVSSAEPDLELGEQPLPPSTPPIPLRNLQETLRPARTSVSPSVASLRASYERPHSSSSS